jgi:beta-glucosidase
MAKLTFPNDFIWGIGNSAYQSEGAWNEDGKGESIWDRYCHIAGNVIDGESGDVTTDFYHRYKEDIALMKSLGIRHFRMSIAWTRILPSGRGEVNPKGVAFYHDVIDELLQSGIEPMVTIYMWDLPQKLQDIGGWANREITDYYEQYARILFREYGGKVKTWCTFDEPFCGAFIGHYIGTYAPGLRDFSTALLVSYHMLLAHGKAVKACHEMTPGAKIGIALNLSDCKSATDKPADIAAAYRADGYRNRWFLDPLYKGCFPQDMLDWYAAQGVVTPDILPEDLNIMSERQDYLGLNFYSPHFYVHDEKNWPVKGTAVKTGKPLNDINWEIVPEALFNILQRVKADYGDIEVKITESGSCVTDNVNREHRIMDDGRIDYMYTHLAQLKRAMRAGVRVTAYYAFCFTDNLEWALGFTKRFGLVYVDFKTQERIVKDSGHWYSRVIRENGFELAEPSGE